MDGLTVEATDQDDANGTPQTKEPLQPDDFKTRQEFLEYIRKTVDADMLADKDNREASLDDGRFFVGKQWPDDVEQRRTAARKPVMVFNQLPAYVGQLSGNNKLNETVINILPDTGATKDTAALRKGLIRGIEKNSRASVAYDRAYDNCVVCGIGNFMVELQYAYNDVFKQDINIRQIPNAHAVIWDRMSFDPTGKDAGHVSVVDNIPEDNFKLEYPWAVPTDVTTDTALLSDLQTSGWLGQGMVRVVNFWRVRSRLRKLALFNDGSVQDVTDRAPGWEAGAARDAAGAVVQADRQVKFAELYIVCGTSILEGPYKLPISRVPVFRVPGHEFYVGEDRHRWGLVRFLKDPQRYKNYWRSVQAEQLTKSPKANWVARANAVEGREPEWRNSHLSDDMLLIFNEDASEAPQLVQPRPIDAALIQESQQNTQDMRDISNMHEASFGQSSNEVSGKAIVARQRVGELGGIVYSRNLELAKEECGRVIDELIPHVYSQQRVVCVIGDDDKESMVAINQPDPANPEKTLNDMTLGKYRVTATTGPSTATKRVEAQEGMLNLVNAVPQTAAIIAPEIVEAQDWPGATKMARKLRAAEPPELQDPADMTPQQQAQAQAQAQAQQQTAQLALDRALVELDKAKAEVAEIKSKVLLNEAQAHKAEAMPRIDAARADTDARSTQLNDTIKVIEAAHPEKPEPKPKESKGG